MASKPFMPRLKSTTAAMNLVGLEGLHPEKLHAADPQDGQHRHRHDDDADAAQPLQDRAPQKDPWRRIVQSDDDRGSGGGDAGDGLEKAIDEAELQLGETER
jgi:hypothetical protein